jgi:hypothetical protein
MEFTMASGTTMQLILTTDLTTVPEPSSMALAGLGALGLIGFALRRRKAMGA